MLLNAMKRVAPEMDCNCDRYIKKEDIFKLVWER
jgi:hypothetical protein